MKYIALILAALASSLAGAESHNPWLLRVPASAGSWRDWTEISSSAFFEVPASKLPTAEHWLAQSAFLAQDNGGLKYFGRPEFACAAPAKPYLVRAAYVNGGTGGFGLFWAGTALVVSHVSLGPGGAASNSALIACLAQEPSAVYSSISGAL